MDPIGLAVGIVGLYSTCIEAVKWAKSYKGYEFESRYIITQFNASELHLRKWAMGVGIADSKLKDKHHDKLDDPEINSTACQVLYSIRQILNDTHDIFSPLQGRLNHDIESFSTTFSSLPDNHHIALPTKHQTPTRRRDKIKWSFGGKTKFIDQVNKFENLVNMLYMLIPFENENESSEGSQTVENLLSDVRNGVQEILVDWTKGRHHVISSLGAGLIN